MILLGRFPYPENRLCENVRQMLKSTYLQMGSQRFHPGFSTFFWVVWTELSLTTGNWLSWGGLLHNSARPIPTHRRENWDETRHSAGVDVWWLFLGRWSRCAGPGLWEDCALCIDRKKLARGLPEFEEILEEQTGASCGIWSSKCHGSHYLSDLRSGLRWYFARCLSAKQFTVAEIQPYVQHTFAWCHTPKKTPDLGFRP